MKKFARLARLLGSTLFFVSCMGGGTDTETGGTNISGRIVSTDGNPAARVRTLLVPSSFNPLDQCRLGDSLIDTTDEEGRYSFTVDSGMFNLQAYEAKAGTRLFVPGIKAVGNRVDVPTDTLQLPSRIKIVLDTSVAVQGGYVYLLGSTIHNAFAKGAADVTLDSVPLGTYPEIRLTKDDSCDFLTLYKNVEVDTPESVLDLPDSLP